MTDEERARLQEWCKSWSTLAAFKRCFPNAAPEFTAAVKAVIAERDQRKRDEHEAWKRHWRDFEEKLERDRLEREIAQAKTQAEWVQRRRRQILLGRVKSDPDGDDQRDVWLTFVPGDDPRFQPMEPVL